MIKGNQNKIRPIASDTNTMIGMTIFRNPMPAAKKHAKDIHI